MVSQTGQMITCESGGASANVGAEHRLLKKIKSIAPANVSTTENIASEVDKIECKLGEPRDKAIKSVLDCVQVSKEFKFTE
jgi:hypothetical protein